MCVCAAWPHPAAAGVVGVGVVAVPVEFHSNKEAQSQKNVASDSRTVSVRAVMSKLLSSMVVSLICHLQTSEPISQLAEFLHFEI